MLIDANCISVNHQLTASSHPQVPEAVEHSARVPVPNGAVIPQKARVPLGYAQVTAQDGWLCETKGLQMSTIKETFRRPFTVQVPTCSYNLLELKLDVCVETIPIEHLQLCVQIRLSRSWKLLHPKLNAGQSNPLQVRQDSECSALRLRKQKAHHCALSNLCVKEPLNLPSSGQIGDSAASSNRFGWIWNKHIQYITQYLVHEHTQCCKMEKDKLKLEK